MTVTSIRDAWAEVRKIFPTDYEYSTERSKRAPHLLQQGQRRERLDQRLGQPPGGQPAGRQERQHLDPGPGGGHRNQRQRGGNRGHRERHQGGAARNSKADPVPYLSTSEIWYCGRILFYMVSSIKKEPNGNTTNLDSSDEGSDIFGVARSNAAPAFEKKSVLNEMAKFIKIFVVFT